MFERQNKNKRSNGDARRPGATRKPAARKSAPRMAKRHGPSAKVRAREKVQRVALAIKLTAHVAAKLMLPATAALAIYAATQIPRVLDVFPVRSIIVKGPFVYLNKNTVEQLIIENAGGNFFTVDIGSMRASISELKWVQSVQIAREWPGTLRVDIVEREPLAKWRGEQIISTDGSVFEPGILSLNAALPSLDGPEGRQDFVMDEYRKMSAMLRRIGLKVAHLSLEDRNTWTIRTDEDLVIIVDGEQRAEKIRQFVEVYPTLLSKNPLQLGKLERVDLRYKNGVAVKWRQPKYALTANN
ncbi:MAG TPA: cell division protein FtsQ/DivIB [Pseudomonadales bacterium]|nr:cell division protein FtsQ/DivIB [Pseudomonadales bacterium]